MSSTQTNALRVAAGDHYRDNQEETREPNWVKLEVPADIPKRPAKLNSQGKEINVKLNNFNVLSMPKSAIYQYDVRFLPSTVPLSLSSLTSCRSSSARARRSVA